jgi:hypothetical protein
MRNASDVKLRNPLLDERGNWKLATMSDYTCELRRQTHRLGDRLGITFLAQPQERP